MDIYTGPSGYCAALGGAVEQGQQIDVQDSEVRAQLIAAGYLTPAPAAKTPKATKE